MLKMNEGAEIFVDAMSEHTAAAQKEKIVFDEAFTLHHRTVFRAARSVVQDAGLAEDVTQEVFLRLYNNIDSTGPVRLANVAVVISSSVLLV